jgi:2-octaprenylphenol hydroxylase
MISNQPQAESNSFDLVIIGSGLVGCALAASLAGDRNLTIALVDRQPATKLPDKQSIHPRVSAISPASKALLKQLGVWQPLAKRYRLTPFSQMRVWDQQGTGELTFSADQLGHPALGYIVENQLLVYLLQQQLAEKANIHWYYEAELAQLGPAQQHSRQLVLTNGKQLSARLVVGADGGRSQVRQQAAIALKSTSYSQQAIVATIKTQHPHQATAWQVFTDHGPLALLPVTLDHHDKQNYCSIVWSTTEQAAEQLMAVDVDHFSQALSQASQYRLGKLSLASERYAFPLWQGYPNRYCQPRLVLVGDAAHVIHPLAGQGVNLGLQDVACLAQLLTDYLARGGDIGDIALLNRYQWQRMGENRAVMALMTQLNRLFRSNPLAIRWVRNQGMAWLNHLPWAKTRLMEKAMGLKPFLL